MAYWKILWGVGIVLFVIIGFIIHESYLYIYSKSIEVIMSVVSIILIFIVGGITNGWFVQFGIAGGVSAKELVISDIIIGFIIYFIIFYALEFENFDRKISHNILFLVTFIISTAFWTPIIRDYYRNIETITETTKNTEERQLLYFCNIPVQEVSGKISGSAFYINGEISTLDELPYWYINENNEGIFDSVPARNSKIVFLTIADEQPYVEIITYITYTKKINHNNGKNQAPKVIVKDTVYVFHLPKEIMQYPLE